MQKTSFRIWTRATVSISDDDKRYTTDATYVLLDGWEQCFLNSLRDSY